ncbi:MAG: CRP-like cAMP-binding protein, partial [Gammaproteobacteria bacterium]
MKVQELTTQFTANQFLFKEGEEGNYAYIIESGSVEVSVQKNDRKLILAILGEGDLLGEMAIIDKRPRTASARAITDTNVVGIPTDYVNRKIEFCDPTVKVFLQVILERYRDVHARLLHVFEGINEPTDADNPQFYATSNVVKELMFQYMGMQDRILTAVNATANIEVKRGIDEQITRNARQLLSVEQNLKHGLVNGEFKLFFQPIVDMNSGEIVGCEALVRWLHPTKGLIPPMEFIPQAESTGLIVELGYWIVETACLFQQRLTLQHDKPLFVSINLSGKQFEDENLISNLLDIMGQYDINPALIKYEITETLLMADPELAGVLLLK